MADPTRPASLRTVLAALLSAIVILQVTRLAQSAYPLIINKVWVNRHLDAIERSADAAYGQSYLSAIREMRQRIPPDGTLLLTGTVGLPQYEAVDFVQYFMFPRKVELLECPGDSTIEVCILASARARVYVLVGESLDDPLRLRNQLSFTPIGAGIFLLEPSGARD